MPKDRPYNELLIPEAAKNDADSIEVMRVWIADKDQHFTLRVGLWNDPGAWGLLLADLANNIAASYEQDAALDRKATLDRIKLAFNTELDHPSDSCESGGVGPA
jgi:Domain of unknown function (DUF5076)